MIGFSAIFFQLFFSKFIDTMPLNLILTYESLKLIQTVQHKLFCKTYIYLNFIKKKKTRTISHGEHVTISFTYLIAVFVVFEASVKMYKFV
jgi:hypothetical protein